MPPRNWATIRKFKDTTNAPLLTATPGTDAPRSVSCADTNTGFPNGLVGPRALDGTTGLKFVPGTLTAVQVAALARATCAAPEHELTAGPSVLVGDDEWLLSEGVVVLRRATRQPLKALERLGGTGLLTYSGCAAPTAA
jgi:hypothetical protein